MRITALSALALMQCSPAFAAAHATNGAVYTQPPEVSFWEPTENDPEGALGIIRHFNQIRYRSTATIYITLETPYGDVTLAHTITPNAGCEDLCPDTLVVIDLPEGIAAIPMDLTTPEREVGNIVLYRVLAF